jgi:hypothetical protein
MILSNLNEERFMAEVEVPNQTVIPTRSIDESDLIDLWKYFEDRADSLKERQWTVGTWILTLLSGLIVFAIDQGALAIAGNRLAALQPLPALGLGLLGILLCIYGWLVLFDYGRHIQRNWDRSGRVKKQIEGINLILIGKPKQKPQKPKKGLTFPRESITLMVILAGYFGIFLLIVLLSLAEI